MLTQILIKAELRDLHLEFGCSKRAKKCRQCNQHVASGDENKHVQHEHKSLLPAKLSDFTDIHETDDGRIATIAEKIRVCSRGGAGMRMIKQPGIKCDKCGFRCANCSTSCHVECGSSQQKLHDKSFVCECSSKTCRRGSTEDGCLPSQLLSELALLSMLSGGGRGKISGLRFFM